MINAAVCEILETVNGDCVFLGHVPDGPKYPVIIYAPAGHEKSLNIDASTDKPGSKTARYDVDVLAKTGASAEQIAKTIQDSYHGWRGAAAGIDISLIQVQGEGALFEDNDKIWAFPLSMTVSYT